PDSPPEILTAADITDPAVLLQELREAASPVSKFLLEKFDPDFTKRILAPAPAPLPGASATPPPVPSLKEWLAQLNRIIEAETLYEKERFQAVTLSRDTQALQAESEGGSGTDNPQRCQRFNR